MINKNPQNIQRTFVHIFHISKQLERDFLITGRKLNLSTTKIS